MSLFPKRAKGIKAALERGRLLSLPLDPVFRAQMSVRGKRGGYATRYERMRRSLPGGQIKGLSQSRIKKRLY